jgi:sigma-E factor negative regulatory protein RseA
MTEELNQQISQFLDDDLDRGESLNLLQQMRQQPQLTGKLNRYEAISHALKTDVFIDVKADFSARISQQLEHEPTYLKPKIKIKSKAFQPHYKHWALAASITVFAVLAQRGLQSTAPDQQMKSQSFQLAQHQPNPQTTSAKPTQDIQQPSLNARINEYLQAHNSSIYTNNEAELKPLTRVTSYNQE